MGSHGPNQRVPLPRAPSPALLTGIKKAAFELCLKVNTENKQREPGHTEALWEWEQVTQDGRAHKESV